MSIRTRIMLLFVAVVAAGFFLLVDWIADDLRPRYLESMEEPLVDVAHLIATWLGRDWPAEQRNFADLKALFDSLYAQQLSARIYALEKRRIDLRLYITDDQGKVLFHASDERLVGRDFSRWNDVHLTLQGRYGARASWEGELNDQLVLYIAAPIVRHGQLLGVVSIGKPATHVDHFIARAQHKLFTAGVVATLCVLGLGLVLYLWMTRPLAQLTRYAQAVVAGERVTLPLLGRHEIGMMGSAMEAMRNALAGRDYAQHYVQTLTHELKSPLAAIRGAAELLSEEMPAQDRQRFLANIRTETERLHDLVERLLALAELEKRTALKRVETIDVAALVEDVAMSLAPLTALKKIDLNYRLAAPLYLKGEPFLVRQALANLVRNGLEFSPCSQPLWMVAGPACYALGGRRLEGVLLSVIDGGPGIPDYAVDKVFDRFYSLPRPSAPNETAAGRKGTGLGLSFVKEVAELHGGHAWLEPGVGVGTCARLFLSNAPPTARRYREELTLWSSP